MLSLHVYELPSNDIIVFTYLSVCDNPMSRHVLYINLSGVVDTKGGNNAMYNATITAEYRAC